MYSRRRSKLWIVVQLLSNGRGGIDKVPSTGNGPFDYLSNARREASNLREAATAAGRPNAFLVNELLSCQICKAPNYLPTRIQRTETVRCKCGAVLIQGSIWG